MKYAMMEAYAGKVPVRTASELLVVMRQGYQEWRLRGKSQRQVLDELLTAKGSSTENGQTVKRTGETKLSPAIEPLEGRSHNFEPVFTREWKKLVQWIVVWTTGFLGEASKENIQ